MNIKNCNKKKRKEKKQTNKKNTREYREIANTSVGLHRWKPVYTSVAKQFTHKLGNKTEQKKHYEKYNYLVICLFNRC